MDMPDMTLKELVKIVSGFPLSPEDKAFVDKVNELISLLPVDTYGHECIRETALKKIAYDIGVTVYTHAVIANAFGIDFERAVKDYIASRTELT